MSFRQKLHTLFVHCPWSIVRSSLIVSPSDRHLPGTDEGQNDKGPSKVKIDERRKDHSLLNLREEDLDPDPIRQFRLWLDEALQSDILEMNAMALATATPEGRPSVRMVLLRGYDERGFTFFTNYESRKAREIEANPYASMVFFWHELERQVRIEGRIERTSAEESDRYFQGRPAGSRLGAWVSPQSQVIAGRDEMETQFRALEDRCPDGSIPRPKNWGGYRLIPESIEFWQGRPNRLHDRLRYVRQPEGGWLIERLAP
jgi:pyridoxamine 5'-phosphate oxidase